MKIRISKTQSKNFPTAVWNAIMAAKTRHESIKSFALVLKPHGFAYTAGEGEQITVVYGDTTAPTVEMVSEHSIGAAGVDHGIGATAMFPIGSFVIVVGYYAGFHMTVYNITENALP